MKRNINGWRVKIRIRIKIPITIKREILIRTDMRPPVKYALDSESILCE